MTQIPDQSARDEALNIQRSFIVQAPAGSGKTSLLTQRYLSLLAKVQNPEEVIAITFTKKAAGEMQERIIEALMKAKQEAPTESYLLTTYNLATAALKQNELHNWSIFDNKYRLRILTIDAFCLLLTNRMPLLSKAIPYSFVADDPDELYRHAAEQTLKTAASNESYLPCLEIIQTHLANNHAQLISLFILMLQKREQWLPHVISANTLNKSYFEQVLGNIQDDLCEQIDLALSDTIKSQMESIIHYQSTPKSSSHNEPTEPFPWHDFSCINQMAHLFLSSCHQPRKRYTKKEGFPSAASFKNTEEKLTAKNIKQILSHLSETLENSPDLLNLLQQAKLIPVQAYSNGQWQVLEALLSLLPLLAAELSVIFSQTTKVDFSEISMQALHALGDETPTELALYLDYEINHLLIDEFQDTSKKQYRLLERLTESWFDGDGKTLFLVGDPMQSIYRFREADVGLFLNIQHSGINQIPIKPLQLTCNFRSSASLVTEVNNICKNIFPTKENIDQGAVTYACSDSLSKNQQKAFFGIRCYDRHKEALYIKQYISEHPDETIAILIRSRSQLKQLMPILHDANLQVEGVNLENLTNRYVINLLLSITRLILNPNDLLSLSEVLVSPLCGISFDILEQLLANTNQKRASTLAELLTNCETLTFENIERTKKILHIFIYNQTIAYRQSISDSVHFIWQHLNGAFLVTEKEQADVEKFWQLIGSHDKWPFDLCLFERQLANRTSEQPNECNVKIMTIHRSKGLEFDTIILPSMNYTSNAQSTPLLNWLEIPFTDDLLLSPIHSAFDEKDPLGHFIQSKEKQKETYERQRLFYVAITRAKTKLILMDASQKDRKPSKNSFLSYVSDHIKFSEFDIPVSHFIEEKNKYVSRLKQDLFKISHALADNEVSNELPKNILQSPSQMVGEYIHQQLFFIAENNLSLNAVSQDINQHIPQLLKLGLKTTQIPFALKTISKCLSNIKDCQTAQWIFNPRKNAQNELQLNTAKKHFIVDRTFVEDDIRWIVDHKITEDPTQHIENYQAQLNLYATLFQQMESSRKIMLMLYYPLVKHSITWAFEEGVTKPCQVMIESLF